MYIIMKAQLTNYTPKINENYIDIKTNDPSHLNEL